MRQAGIVAAAGLYALDHHVARLADDHANARRLAEGLVDAGGAPVDLEQVESNFVFLHPGRVGLSRDEAVARLRAEGVLVSNAAPRGRPSRSDTPRRLLLRHRACNRACASGVRASAVAREVEGDRDADVGGDQDDAARVARAASEEEDRDERDRAAHRADLDRPERERERLDRPRQKRDCGNEEDRDLGARRERDLGGELQPPAGGDDDGAAVLGGVPDDRDDDRRDEEIGEPGVLGERLERSDEGFGDEGRRDRCDPEDGKGDR